VSAFTLEGGLGVLMLAVLVAGLFARGDDRRWLGWLATAGVLVLIALSLAMAPTAPRLGGAFALDGLAIFAKRLFLVATFIGLLGGVSAPDPVFRRRAGEYHLLVLASLLGMLVLASARDLILLFVAFELMSLPLYALSGFRKRDGVAVEAALKFFLVGSVSSAVMAYGLSFVYGAARTTQLAGVARAFAAGDPWLVLGLVATFVGFGFKIAAFPFHMWVPDTYEAATTPFVAWLSVAPKAAGFVAIFRVYFEGLGPDAGGWSPMAAGLATLTIVGGNLMALPQQNAKRLLAYSGIGSRWCSSTWSRTSSATWARSWWWRPSRARRNPSRSRRSAAWLSARRCWRWRCCCSCSRSGASRSSRASGPSCGFSGPRRSAGSTGSCWWEPSSRWSHCSITC
jgi:NADH-quinone oxidoreductase subunit N